MILTSEGQLTDKIYALGIAPYPAYVISGDKKSMMIDAGLNIFGPRYMSDFYNNFSTESTLDYLLLTHSHFDHLGAMPYMKRQLPDLQVGAHERVKSLLAKESVLTFMNNFSDMQKMIFKDFVTDEDVAITNEEPDLILSEGMEIDLGNLTCQVIETPGHTADSLSFYFPEIKALFPGETSGILIGLKGEGVKSEFVSSYTDCIKSIEKLMDLDLDFLGISHVFSLTGEDAQGFMARALTAAEDYRKLIEYYLNEAHSNIEETIELMVKKEYEEKGNIFQEKNAYKANLTAQVKSIAQL